MKLLGIEIERMIPVEEEGRMNVRFAVNLEDPMSDSPFGMQVTVPVSLAPDATYATLKSAALGALHETLADLASNTVADLSNALEKGI